MLSGRSPLRNLKYGALLDLNCWRVSMRWRPAAGRVAGMRLRELNRCSLQGVLYHFAVEWLFFVHCDLIGRICRSGFFGQTGKTCLSGLGMWDLNSDAGMFRFRRGKSGGDKGFLRISSCILPVPGLDFLQFDTAFLRRVRSWMLTSSASVAGRRGQGLRAG